MNDATVVVEVKAGNVSGADCCVDQLSGLDVVALLPGFEFTFVLLILKKRCVCPRFRGEHRHFFVCLACIDIFSSRVWFGAGKGESHHPSYLFLGGYFGGGVGGRKVVQWNG